MSGDAPIDIALAIDALERGGAERVLVDIANGLDPDRFNVHVILTRNRGPLATELSTHVRVHSLERRSRSDLLAARRFNRVIVENDIRLVHTHNHSAAYFARVARIVGRGSWLHVMHDHHGPVESSVAHRLLDRSLLRNVDYYLAVSSRLEAYAGNWIGIASDRRELLANGIPVPVAMTPPPATPITVVQVARLVPEKNQKLAIMAAFALRAWLPDMRWLLVGRNTSPYAAECAHLIEEKGLGENVMLVGERSDVGKLLAAAHIGVITSDFEGLPIALLEYMAAGLPVVVTDVGDCASVVRASGGGSIVPAGDVEALGEALRRYASDPSAARRAGAANRVYVESHHGIDGMVQRVSVIYETLLGTGSKQTSYSRRAVGSA